MLYPYNHDDMTYTCCYIVCTFSDQPYTHTMPMCAHTHQHILHPYTPSHRLAATQMTRLSCWFPSQSCSSTLVWLICSTRCFGGTTHRGPLHSSYWTTLRSAMVNRYYLWWYNVCTCIVLGKHPQTLTAQAPKIEGGWLHGGGAWMVQLSSCKHPPQM